MFVKHESLPTIAPVVVSLLKKTLKKHPRRLKIADLGSGSNPKIFVELSKFFLIDYYALDVNGKRLDKFRHDASQKTGGKVNIVKADIEKTPFPSNFFDAVITLETIEHLKHPQLALKQIIRISKPKAIILISTPNIERPDVKLKKILFSLLKINKIYPQDYYYDPTHIQEWTVEEFKNIVHSSGLKIKKWCLIPYPIEFVGLKSLITLVLYPLLNLIIFASKNKNVSPIQLVVCKCN